MTREEEQQIIAQVLAGDVQRFEPLVKANESGVYNLALRMLGNAQDALDASQEAFFRAYRALASFRGDSKFSVWLYRMTSNVCLDILRKRSRRDELSLTDEGASELPLPDLRYDPQGLLEKKEMRRAVRRGMEKLSPEFREALALRDGEGLSYEEIGQVTGLESGTVKSRIYRARRKLAAILMADGNFSGREPSYESTARGGGKDEKL